MRVRFLAALGLAAVLLVVLAGDLALPAQAQTATTLVSNTAETAVGGSSNFLAQSFETGANATGYTVTEVQIRVSTATSRSTSLRIREDDGGEPGALVATFMNPASPTSQSLNTFTAPANTTLEASTTYWISVNEGISLSRMSYSATSGDDETGEMGWSIGNDRLWRGSESSNWEDDAVNLVLAIKGTPAPPGPTVVPSDWSLIPAGLSSGDQFRLIFLSSTKRDGSSSDIATYNTFIQTRAAAGHTDIQAYSAGFSVVGCTADVDARDNTGTTGVGVLIYWLNGAKVADDYADFYDEDWDEEAADKNELGNNGPNTNNSGNYPLTGCDDDGTEAFQSTVSLALGASTVTVGRPDSSTSGHGPLSSGSNVGSAATRPMYGLSAVFEVAAVVTNSDPTFPMSTAARDVAENTAAGQNVGAVLTASDSDGDTLTYSLEGTDATSFVLDTTTTAGSAQIQTKTGVTYNHEAKSSYTVVVKADDGGGGTAASVTVTITITDVIEAPERPAAPAVTATSGSTTSLSVSWTEPATTGPDIDDYDLRYRAGTSGNWSNGPQNVTATLASIGSLDAGTSYQVQVRATNNEGNSNWSLSGSGSTTAEATPTVSISADKTSAVFKQDGITYTLTRSGSTTGALTVSVTLTQTKDFLLATELTKMVTIAAGQSTETFTVAASSFQHFAAGAMVEGGTLTAAVQDVLGYDLGSPSSVDVSIVIGATVRIELASSTVAEAGGTLAVKLIARTGAGAPQPTSNTSSLFFGAVDQTALNTIDYAFTDTSNDFQPSDFSMTSGVWQAELTFDITITNDAIDEDDETFDLKLEYQVGHQNSPLVDASGNSCGDACEVTVTITDDDTAGVTISKTALMVTEEDASGDTYTVVLDSQPTADVTISIGGQSGTDVTAAPTPMTFTSMNWATAQTVTVTGDDDADLTNDMVSLTHNAVSSDGDYQGITIAGVMVTVNDNDTAQVLGLMVEPGNAQLVVGWTAVANATGYQVQWKSGGQGYNTSGRQATISSGSTTSHTISSLTNGTEYTVRVRATRTGANAGAYSSEVLETPVMPTVAGVTVSKSALTVTEQDSTGDTYTVVLDRLPTASVTVTVGGLGSSDLTANPASLTFTTGNWATAQMVTVTAGNDADTTNDTVSLSHSAMSSDSAYQGITIAGLTVTVADNDTAQVLGLMVEPGNAQLVVGWTAVSNATGYEVQWKSGGQSYNNSRQATISSGSTTSHTISSLSNGTEYTVRVRATRTGANSGAYSAEALETPVMPTAAGVTVSESALTLTEQDSTGDSYTVVLDRLPTASVTVTVGGLGSSDLTANPSSLTFTTGNWATAQMVTVTAGNDADTTNDTVSLSHSAVSSDSAYQGITIAGVTVTVADNDTAQVTGVMITPGNAQLAVEWTSVANATGYEVQWKSGGQSYNNSRQATISSGSTTSHTISSLSNGTEYTVRVRATRTGANAGAYSDEAMDAPEAATTPEVTISADKSSAVLKGDGITYTVTRTGSTTDDLPVTLALTQTGDFLAAADLARTVTIAAGQSTQTLTVAATSFQDFAPGSTAEGGTLTAAVQAGTGYVLGTPDSVDVTIIVALTVGFEMASYSVAEEAGPLAVKLVARTGAGALAPDADFFISFSTAELDPLEARIVHDYGSVSTTVLFAPSDFSADGSVFKAEQTVSVVIVDDEIDEQAERFAVLLDITPGLLRKYDNFVDTNGAACPDPLCPALVTIIDTDPASADITGIEITSRPANGISYLEGEAITVAVTYDQAVAVDTTSGTPTLEIEIDVAQAASYTSISSDNLVLTFSYTIAGDDQDQNGIVIPAGSIELNGGAITLQGTSVAANLAYPRIGRDATQKVNTDPRVISGGVAVTSSPAAKRDTYGVGETIRFTVTFDSPVAVDTTSGTPVLGFRLANSSTTPANKDLDYVSGSGTAALTFEYVVQSGDTDTNGISVRNNWLDANGGANGAITHETTGRDARLNHGRPGNNGNFPGHKVDGSLGPSVPNDWVLKPSGLGGGDQFRLIFLSSTGDPASSSDIEDYNDFVRDSAASGHAAIQAYGAAFNVVGCTASIDARDNTHSTYTNANKGVPIYWLNGAKVADEYEDFYDGSWDDETNDKNQFGFNGLETSNVANYPWTGCDDDGTEATGMALGDTTPRVGRPNSTDTGNGPIGSVTTKANADHRPFYGLSAVFTVEVDTAAPGAPTGLTATANGPEEFDLSWSAPSSIGGAAITGYKIEFSINGGTTWSDLVADTGATDTTRSHSSNLSTGNTRHYRVSAINPGGAGPASNVAFATTAAADVLVSNTGQNGDPADRQSIGDQDKTHSQGFETGSNPAGYSLASVGVHVSNADLAAGETFTVHIYTADGSGGLDALAFTLTSPNIYKNNAVNKFTAPDGATLAAGAAYHVVFQATGNAASDVVLGVTSSNEQDTGSERLWTIEDARRFEGSPSSAGTNYKVSVNGTARPILVPSDWSLKPTGLTAGDQFRLIFVSSTKRNAVPIDIVDYNTFVQGRAAAGHTDIQAYSAGFSVVGCTADTDARDNTGTTGTGVPIYWLNGDPDNAKVADDYADFYDGDWDEERQNKNRDESGADGPSTATPTNYPFTGCKHNGTERFSGGDSFALGAQNVIVGRPNDSTSTSGPIGSNTPVTRPSNRPFYGLSTVFQVASSALPDVPTRLIATAVGQTQIDLYWITPASNNGLAVTGYRIEVSSNGGVSWTDLVSNTNSDATTYSHTGLLAGATRTYRVSAINSTGLGPPSGTAFAITEPAQVMGLMVEQGDMQLVVNWTAVDNATGYRVQWKSGVQDYNTGDRQAVIPSGSTIRHTIESLDNGTAYTVQVTATQTGANDGPPSAEVMETPAEPMEPELSLTPVNPTVDETGGTAVFTVTLFPASSGTVTVDYATSDIIADAGMDYTATSGTLTFMPGETSKTITIPILNDTVYEITERFRVTLSNPTGAALSAASFANVHIANDDAVPIASMEDVSVNENTGTMTLTLALSHASSLAVTYETSDIAVSGTATRPDDYLNFLQGARATITVPAGDSSATFDITIVDDRVDESDETIIIRWTREAGIEAIPSEISFTGTIRDNDPTGVTVSETALTVTEEDAAGDSYTVVLDTQPAANVTVTVAGHANTDVTPTPATLTFTTGNWQTAQTVTVTAGDDADTADDTVSLSHSVASGDSAYQGITIDGVTVTVEDNDTAPPIITTPPVIGGGGGGGGGGPSPSTVDFEWNVTRDIDELDASHDKPSGMWSDGATLWLADNPDGAGDAVYAYDLESGERVEEREFELDASQPRPPRRLVRRRARMDLRQRPGQALRLRPRQRRAPPRARPRTRTGTTDDVRGIWSDGQTMWVLDGRARRPLRLRPREWGVPCRVRPRLRQRRPPRPLVRRRHPLGLQPRPEAPLRLPPAGKAGSARGRRRGSAGPRARRRGGVRGALGREQQQPPRHLGRR